ncbi:MAG: SRPBCC family protein [Burkholderiales bacterium]
MLNFLLIIAVIVTAILIYASTRPDSFRVERATIINAPPEKVFPIINDFHAWEGWSPWEKLDPNVKRSYDGAGSGVGAKYAWAGNKQLGEGKMEIIESTPYTHIGLNIYFIKPMQAQNKIDFTLERQGGATKVVHAMHGPSPFISKLMSLVFNMEKMVGPKFEEGLASIKAIAEK